jgi:hypothetical protein
MSTLLPENRWKLVVNANYQDVMKTLMNLTTASLVLPFLFIRTFLGVPEGKRLADDLPWPAYGFWGLLLLSLMCDMAFFWASAKFIKAVSRGNEDPSEGFFETCRDWAIKVASVSFVLAFAAFSILAWEVLHRA